MIRSRLSIRCHPENPNTRRLAAVITAEAQADRVLTTTRFNVAEILVGVEKSTDPVRAARNAERALASLVILEFDEHGARLFARIRAHLSRAGRPSGDFDELIGAVAAANGQSLIARNVKHFTGMPGLEVIGY